MIHITDNRENAIIATDMDEILVDISPKWYSLVRENWDDFKEFFKDKGDLTPSEVLSRDIYYMDNWLKKDELDILPAEIQQKFVDLYAKGDFYGDLKPTYMGSAIAALSMQRYCKKVYIVSHTIPGAEDTKIKFFKRHFNSSKFQLVMLPPDVKKSEFVKEIEYNTFIDDRPEMHKDIIENTASTFKEFLIPQLGYNNIFTHPCGLYDLVANKKNVAMRSYEVIA